MEEDRLEYYKMFFFARLAPFRPLSRCLLTKFLHRSSVGSLLRVRRWLGVLRIRRQPRGMGGACSCKSLLSDPPSFPARGASHHHIRPPPPLPAPPPPPFLAASSLGCHSRHSVMEEILDMFFFLLPLGRLGMDKNYSTMAIVFHLGNILLLP